MSARRPPRILLTGFEPFAGETVNPAWAVAHALHGRQLAGHRIHAIRLAVEFGRSLQQLEHAVRQQRPALVLCLGQAGGRSAISLERVAINVDDARIPDNAGRQPIDRPIEPQGPAAYFSTLPIKAMRQALLDTGMPAEISQSAGTFVCNHVFYGLMHRLAATPRVRGGFVHIPYLPEQAARHPGAPSMAMELLVQAVRRALQVAIEVEKDAGHVGGALD